MPARILFTAIGVGLLFLGPSPRLPRSDARQDAGTPGDLAAPDHSARDAILNRLRDPKLIFRVQQNIVRGSMELEDLIRRLGAFRNDRVVIRALLGFDDMRAIEWEGDPPRPVLVYASFEQELSVPRPAREVLVGMGPSATPHLVDEYIDQFRQLGGAGEDAPPQAVLGDPDLGVIFIILSSRPDTALATVRLAGRRIADQPNDRAIQRACRNIIEAMLRHDTGVDPAELRAAAGLTK
jgi:hypothetical protein